MKRDQYIKNYAMYRHKQDEKITELSLRIREVEKMLDFVVSELMERLS